MSLETRWMIWKITSFRAKINLKTAQSAERILALFVKSLFHISDCVFFLTFCDLVDYFLVFFGEIIFQKLGNNQLFGCPHPILIHWSRVGKPTPYLNTLEWSLSRVVPSPFSIRCVVPNPISIRCVMPNPISILCVVWNHIIIHWICSSSAEKLYLNTLTLRINMRAEKSLPALNTGLQTICILGRYRLS